MRETTSVYKVIANCEDVYAIWPAARQNPSAWRTVESAGSLEECRAYIARIEAETRSDVLRRALERKTSRP